MLIIFDIDETLLCVQYEGDQYYQDSSIQYDHIYKMDKYILKFSLRPHTKYFLNKLLDIGFDLAIWTYGSDEYARHVAHIILNYVP